MTNLFIQEQWVNATDGHSNGESGVYESFTDSPGELFRSCQREYGRCVGKVYIDGESGVQAIGWVFQKRMQYDDCKETFLLETWVTLHSAPPVKTIEYQYAIGG